MFGSPLAFKSAPEEWGETDKITGTIQINFGETLHKVEETTFHGTSIFRSKGEAEESEQKMGTFTTYYAIPYGLIAFHGVANENAAKTTKLTQADIDKFKVALWKGVRESVSAHTRTKREQQPRLLLNIVYKEKIKIKDKDENGKETEKEVPTEYHIGALEEKIKLASTVGEEINIRKAGDYTLDPIKLFNAITRVKDKITRIEYCLSPEFCDIFESGDPAKKINFVEKLKELAKKNNEETYFEVTDLDIDRLASGV